MQLEKLKKNISQKNSSTKIKQLPHPSQIPFRINKEKPTPHFHIKWIEPGSTLASGTTQEITNENRKLLIGLPCVCLGNE